MIFGENSRDSGDEKFEAFIRENHGLNVNVFNGKSVRELISFTGNSFKPDIALEHGE